MNRRNFLKLSSALIATVSVPAVLFSNWSNGYRISFTDADNFNIPNLLLDEMSKNLAQEIDTEILKKISDDYVRAMGHDISTVQPMSASTGLIFT
jgi:hypothetical protein